MGWFGLRQTGHLLKLKKKKDVTAGVRHQKGVPLNRTAVTILVASVHPTDGKVSNPQRRS